MPTVGLGPAQRVGNAMLGSKNSPTAACDAVSCLVLKRLTEAARAC